jgi:hypothetical protein
MAESEELPHRLKKYNKIRCLTRDLLLSRPNPDSSKYHSLINASKSHRVKHIVNELHSRSSARIQFSGPTASPLPIWALRANLAHWIVDALFVGTANDSIRHSHRVHRMLA